MALTWTTCSGTPSDTIGADGDMAFDYTNRIIWGPRGNVTAGSWTGTANTTKGAQGLGILSGSGAPLPSMGQQGNSYIDVSGGALWLRNASGWNQGGMVTPSFSPILQGSGPPNSSNAPTVLTGQMYYDNTNALLYGPSTAPSYTGLTQVQNLVGPTGAAGPQGASGFSTMANTTMAPGPMVNSISTALASTPASITVQGANIAQIYSPIASSALMGLGATCNTSAVTVALYDQTAGKTLYSANLAVNTNNWLGPFSASAYPMVAGNQHVWQISGSGTTTVQLNPYYLVPSSLAAAAVCPVAGFMTPPSTTLSSTAQNMYSAGIKAASSRNLYFLRAGSLYGYTVTYIPVSGSASATCQVLFGAYNTSAQSTVFTSPAVANTGQPVSFGPFTPGTYSWAAGQLMFLTVTGSGTGQVIVDTQVIC